MYNREQKWNCDLSGWHTDEKPSDIYRWWLSKTLYTVVKYSTSSASIGVILFPWYYLLKTGKYLLGWCTMYNYKRTMYNVLTYQRQTHSLSMIICNYVSTYIFSTCMYQNNRSVKLRKISQTYEEMHTKKSLQQMYRKWMENKLH